MKFKYKFLIGFVIIIILSNTQLGAAIFKIMLDEGHYRYSNSNGSLTFEESKPGEFAWAQRKHNACLLSQPNLKDKRFYRLFSKNPLAFWRWRLYFIDDSYKLPYKSWDEIQKVRENSNSQNLLGCTNDF